MGNDFRIRLKKRKVPCVKFNKTGITFNSSFVEVFGTGLKTRVEIGIDTEQLRLAFRPVNGESRDGWVVNKNGSSKVASKTVRVSCNRPAEAFPDRIGLIFRAMRNADGTILVDLAEPVKK